MTAELPDGSIVSLVALAVSESAALTAGGFAESAEPAESSPPQPAATPSEATSRSSGPRFTSVVCLGLGFAVGHALHDVEALVELDIDLLAVVECDFDFVVAVLVTDFGLGDLPLTGVGEGGRGRLGECVAGDRLLVLVVVQGAGGDGCSDGSGGHE